MTRSIRLLQVAKHFYPDTGGIETVTQSTSDMLVAHDIWADVLCTEARGPYPPLDLPYSVIRCKNDVTLGNKGLSSDYVQQLRKLSADYDCALVHMPNPVAVAGMLAFWKKPFILHWHADIPQAPIRTLSAPFDRALAARAAAIIGPTPIHLAESHLSDALAGKGVVIGYPFDRTRLPAPTGTSPNAARVRAFARGRKLSLSIGRLVSYKGFDMLIEAARSFGDDIAAVIVGGGELRAELEAQIEAQGVGDRVLLAGRVEDAGLADLLDMTHIGCMPSVTAAEMYGVAQVEAFAFGKPVVSTRLARSGTCYVNKHDVTGLVVEPRDPTALAMAMKRLAIDDALYARLSAGASASFATDHDIGPIGERFAELIRAVVTGQAIARAA